jgi:hypothetical protein
MKLFLAVVFFCGNGQCYFWQSKDLYYDQQKCLEAVKAVQQGLEKNDVESEGTCLQINTRNNV